MWLEEAKRPICVAILSDVHTKAQHFKYVSRRTTTMGIPGMVIVMRSRYSAIENRLRELVHPYMCSTIMHTQSQPHEHLRRRYRILLKFESFSVNNVFVKLSVSVLNLKELNKLILREKVGNKHFKLKTN